MTLSVNGNVHLPANAVAMIQQSSLLGEKYVELAAPGNEPPQGKLGNGSLIPLSRTNRNVEVEELLGALSLVLNGGGLAQLQTINQELGDALQGRESAVRDTLTQLDTFVGGLDAQKSEINRALDSVNALAGTLAERTAHHRDGAGHHRPRAEGAQPAAQPAGHDAEEPRAARGRRHADHQPVRAGHRRRPEARCSRSSPSSRRPAPTWPARSTCC